MREFFNYQSPYRTNIFIELTILERIVPILVIGLIIYLIYKYRHILSVNRSFDKRVRYTLGILLFTFYSSHYVLRFSLYGFDTIILPFHLCSISMLFAIVLLFTNNKTIYSFVLLTGVLGSFISFVNPIIGYDSGYYRYYQFFFAHGLLFITPLYYLIVHKWVPVKKEVLNGFIILEGLAIFMLVFNYYNGTDFMFLFIDPDKIDKFPMISNFGGIPYYLFFVEAIGMLYFYGSYKLFTYLHNKGIKSLEGGVYENN